VSLPPPAAQHARRAARADRYAQVCDLQHAGLSQVAIAQELGMARRTVERWVANVAARTESSASDNPAVRQRRPTGPLDTVVVRQALWLVMHDPTRLDPPAQHTLQVMLGCSVTVTTLYNLVQRFRGILHARQGDQLDGWLTAARASAIAELGSFVAGIERDKAAVVAGLSMAWSQGVVEGHVNRLKVIKRQMYGRAGFALLRQRVLYCGS
jgi:hypothetical protein